MAESRHSGEQSDRPDRCRALTSDGERCERSAQADGFCHQHDENDPTVDEHEEDQDESAGGDESESTGEDQGESIDEDESESTGDEDGESSTDTTDENGRESSSDLASDIMAVRETIESVTAELVGHQLDAIIEIRQEEDGWLAIIEVVERPAVPDTQDILGQYEIELAESGTVSGYHRVARFRRGDTTPMERRGRNA